MAVDTTCILQIIFAKLLNFELIASLYHAPNQTKVLPINIDILLSFLIYIYILVLNTDVLLLINIDMLLKNIDVRDLHVLNIDILLTCKKLIYFFHIW